MKNKFQVISPIDNHVYVELPQHDRYEIDAVLHHASEAQKEWKNTRIETRIQFIKDFAEKLAANSERISEELSWQMGRPIAYSPFEVKGAVERTLGMADQACDALANVKVAEKQGFNRFIKREALGIIFVIPAWNYPYLIAVNSIVPALLAGNAVVLRHSAQTPLVAERFFDAFREAGLPEGLFQYLHLDHGDTAKVIQDPRVQFVAFTGSVKGGYEIQKVTQERFIGVGLELGGKDSAYVRNDAPFEFTVENLVDGAFFNSGQSCCGIERIYVHESRYAKFVEAFVALTKKYRLGNPMNQETTLGPLAKRSGAVFLNKQIEHAVLAGAQTLIDPSLFPETDVSENYCAPQVLIDVDHAMPFMMEESFGPAVGIMKVKDDAEAIRLMNDSPYGLTASIWTENAELAVAIGDQINTGTWFMNRCDYLDPYLAWVGVKDSGRGCTLSKVGFEQLTRPKSFHLRVEI
ncbi:MAG: aldehyde dehydrogenase family protein [Calditrichaeota bacterium]|nr:MAG: aldehyde dehydrogenase family protein [Calditrichota bacterium]